MYFVTLVVISVSRFENIIKDTHWSQVAAVFASFKITSKFKCATRVWCGLLKSIIDNTHMKPLTYWQSTVNWEVKWANFCLDSKLFVSFRKTKRTSKTKTDFCMTTTMTAPNIVIDSWPKPAPLWLRKRFFNTFFYLTFSHENAQIQCALVENGTRI